MCDERPAVLSVAQAANYLGISRASAYELVKRGEMPGALRLGRRIVVSRKVLEDFVNAPRAGK